MQPLPAGERINVGNEPHADTHGRCTHGAALVETMSPAIPMHSVCDLTQRDVCDLTQHDGCDLTQHDGCDLLRNMMVAICAQRVRFDAA